MGLNKRNVIECMIVIRWVLAASDMKKKGFMDAVERSVEGPHRILF